MKKILSALIFATSILFTPIFAQSTNEEKYDVDIIQSLKNMGKQTVDTAKDLGNYLGQKANDLGNSLNNLVNSMSTTFCAGDWEFINGKYSTVINCNKDGTMKITQTNSTGETCYEGTYKASPSKINFTVTKKTTKIFFVTTTKDISEEWIINYSLPLSSELKISSDHIPNDANDFDFSRPTIFTEVEETEK